MRQEQAHPDLGGQQQHQGKEKIGKQTLLHQNWK